MISHKDKEDILHSGNKKIAQFKLMANRMKKKPAYHKTRAERSATEDKAYLHRQRKEERES